MMPEKRIAARASRWSFLVWIFALFVLFLSGTVAAEDDTLYGAETCGKCHPLSQPQVDVSVHSAKRTGAKKITCLSCHASHGKTSSQLSNAPIAHGNDIKTCGRCHAAQVGIFNATFHGKHRALGKKNIPTCVFCHAGHELPRAETLSPINYANIGLICADCHGKNAEDRPLMAATLSTPATGRILYRKDIMEPLIKGLMGVSTFGIFVFGLLFVLQWIRNVRGEPLPEKLGWPRWLWIQLLLFFIFFIPLDQTGVALRYSASSEGLIGYPMHKISSLFMSFVGTDDVRSLIHRLAGFGFIITVGVHLFWLAFSSTLRQCVRLPKNWRTSLLNEIRQGITPGRPAAAVKAQLLYRAVVILAITMVITGIAQWNAFWLMKSTGFWSVRYTNIIHEWTGRIFAMTVFGILIGYGIVLRTIAQKIQARKVLSSIGVKTAGMLSVIIGFLIFSGYSPAAEASFPAQKVQITTPLDSPSRGSLVRSPVPGVSAYIFPSAESCKACHPREYQEWKKSYHSQSIHTATFRAMYTINDYETEGKRPEYCFNCHDPATKILGKARAEKLSKKVLNGEFLPSEGVTCTACHMAKDVDPKDYDFTAPATYNVNSLPPYHTVFRSDLTRSSTLCSSCHDYNGLNMPHPEKPTTPCCTVNRELAKTEYAKQKTSCQSCHMRDSMGVMPERSKFVAKLFSLTGLERYLDDRKRVSHLMPGGRDADMLKKAVKMQFVSAEVSNGELRVELELENKAGHSVPNG